MFRLTEDGEEIVLAVRGPGALLGELSAIDGLPRSASVAALEPVVAHVMHVEAFRDFLDSHAQVAVALLHLVVERLRDADRKRVEFAAYDTPARVGAADRRAGRALRRARRAGHADHRRAVAGRAGGLGRRVARGGGQGAARAAGQRSARHRAAAR